MNMQSVEKVRLSNLSQNYLYSRVDVAITNTFLKRIETIEAFNLQKSCEQNYMGKAIIHYVKWNCVTF